MERQVSLATVVRDQGVESSGLGSQTSPEVVPTRLRLLGGIRHLDHVAGGGI